MTRARSAAGICSWPSTTSPRPEQLARVAQRFDPARAYQRDQEVNAVAADVDRRANGYGRYDRLHGQRRGRLGDMRGQRGTVVTAAR